MATKRNVEFNCLSEQVSNLAHNDHRIIEASKKSLRVKRMDWKMNIVKDIVKSNLKFQPDQGNKEEKKNMFQI